MDNKIRKPISTSLIPELLFCNVNNSTATYTTTKAYKFIVATIIANNSTSGGVSTPTVTCSSATTKITSTTSATKVVSDANAYARALTVVLENVPSGATISYGRQYESGHNSMVGFY